MSASSSSKELDKLLAQYPDIQTIGNNKLKCQLSGHEMNSTLDAVQTYVTGPKFKRLHRLKCLLTKFGQYFEERAPNQLYCKITRRTIAKEGIEIERHINGTRFKRALVKFGASVGDEMELDNDEKLSTRNNVKYIEEEDPLSDEDDEDSESSLSAQHENLTDLYPELETSESCDSDFDFRAMDTEMDASAGSKRKLKNSEESKSTKKTRNL